MVPVDTETYMQMEEDYGLEFLCLQNEIEPWEVVRLLHLNGFIDMDDYFFSELHEDETED